MLGQSVSALLGVIVGVELDARLDDASDQDPLPRDEDPTVGADDLRRRLRERRERRERRVVEVDRLRADGVRATLCRLGRQEQWRELLK